MTKKIIGCQGFRGSRVRNEKLELRIFKAVKLFYMILKWIHAIMDLQNLENCKTLRVNSNANYGLLLIIMYLK